MKFMHCIVMIGFLGLSLITNPLYSSAEEKETSIFTERMALYEKTSALTNIPWYYIAAIDQYERNIVNQPNSDALISISFSNEEWFGLENHLLNKSEDLIQLFNGLGRDGNGDGYADPDDPEDAIYSMANYLASYGPTVEDIKIALFDHYKRDLSVQSIVFTARVFKHFQSIELTERHFPVSINHNYSYRSTWGDRRGFGGLRIHEGTDIFANYGTPVYSTTYGVVEIKGWNLYGGWRIGIRDIHNIYHYYAHLNSFAEDLVVGQVVQPGDLIGTVGASGYGPPGTSGKFPPHLHYGMYKDDGYSEWSFDPYPYLRRWERMTK